MEASLSLTIAGRSLAETLHREAEMLGFCRCGHLPMLPGGRTLPPDYEHLQKKVCEAECVARGIPKSGPTVGELQQRLREHDQALRQEIETAAATETAPMEQRGRTTVAEEAAPEAAAAATESVSGGVWSSEAAKRRDTAAARAAAVPPGGTGLSLHAKATVLSEIARLRNGPAPTGAPRSVAELIAREGWTAPVFAAQGALGSAAEPIELDDDSD